MSDTEAEPDEVPAVGEAELKPPAGKAQPALLTAGILQKALAGDFAGMTPKEQLIYYKARCESVGLDYTSLPFGFIKDKDGRIAFYANKGAAEQLARIYGIGVKIKYQDVVGGDLPIWQVLVEGATTERFQRISQDIGCVPLYRSTFIEDPEGPDTKNDWRWVDGKRRPVPVKGAWNTKFLVGQDLCNARMACVTKAKRRCVLSMVGLGMLDESELDTMEVERVDFDLAEGLKLPEGMPDEGRVPNGETE